MDSLNSTLEFSKICRLCLSNDQQLLKIFLDVENLDFQVSLSTKIMDCVSIEIEPGDNFPDQICIRCVEQIENWERFKAMCHNSTSILLQYASEISNISDEVFQENLQSCLKMPSTPDFSFADISILDHDSLLQNIDGSEEEILPIAESIGSNFPSKTVEENIENVNEPSTNKTQAVEDEIKEAQRQKWREKFAKYARKRYTCDLCEVTFTVFSRLLEHDRVEHKDIVHREVCLVCNQMFISKFRLETHKAIKHKEKQYSCETCGFRSVSEKSLRVHQSIHSGRFECHVCGVAKSSARSLEDHVTTHSEDKPFQCDICKQSFKHRQSLRTHLKTHDSHLQPQFQCSVCSKIFKSVKFLNNHKLSHNVENSAVCEICGKSFKNANTLYIHKLSHNEKKHTCMVCDKTFVTKNLLTRHLFVHGPGNLVCVLCGKKFHRKYNLNVHMKLHTSD